jgi:hypothetical protein
MTNALTNDPFYVCISFTNIASSRKATVHTSLMNVVYYGKQNVTTIGTLSNKSNNVPSPGASAGMIVGIVVGTVVGCCLLITVLSCFIAIVIVLRKRSVKPPHQIVETFDSLANIQSNQEPVAELPSAIQPSYEMLNSHASVQHKQNPAIASDIEQPVSPTDHYEDYEPENPISSDNEGVTIITQQTDEQPLALLHAEQEPVISNFEQPVNQQEDIEQTYSTLPDNPAVTESSEEHSIPEDKQTIETETTNTQNAPIVVQEILDGTAIDEIYLPDHVIPISVITPETPSTIIDNATVEQENTTVQTDTDSTTDTALQ